MVSTEDVHENILKEYQISKDSIKSVMGQLVGVAVSLLTVSIVLIKILFDDAVSPVKNDPTASPAVSEPSFDLVESDLLLRLMIILLMNFVIVFVAYQNVQIVALQKHIKSLEEKLSLIDVFRWETTIARVWYGESHVAKLFNILLVLPPFIVFILMYVDLSLLMNSSFWFWLILLGNVLYWIAIGTSFSMIIKRLEPLF